MTWSHTRRIIYILCNEVNKAKFHKTEEILQKSSKLTFPVSEKIQRRTGITTLINAQNIFKRLLLF